MSRNHYDVIIVGAGHAGIEAAHAAARLGAATALVTMNPDTIAQMSCNPALGGLAKGQIVREIDALGGLMALAADAAGIQFRMLNRSKGPAVWAPRAQADKWQYQHEIRRLLAATPNLTIIPDTAAQLLTHNHKIAGLTCLSGASYSASAVVLTTGTFLRGLMHTGPHQSPGGRFGEPPAHELSASLELAGLRLQRLKTGTPPRLDALSIDFQRLDRQPGDDHPCPFSFLNDAIAQPQIDCWITWTNPQTHQIIADNLHRAPLYTGQIKSTGPRYCPSIETKILRFADKSRHQVFLEPEGRDSPWIYCNGISTSLPEDVQQALVHSIVGLENARFLRYGYAIEYDYVPPVQIRATLEAKTLPGLFLAGQINGTSGYEEAAGQGLLAGLNAARFVAGHEPVLLRRDQAYIGVMIDDLVTKGIDEPYRMFTSRAEHRLLLRSDNADVRLTPLGRQWNLIDDARWRRFQQKQQQIALITAYINARRIDGRPLDELLRQQGHNEDWLTRIDPQLPDQHFDPFALQSVVNDIRYAGYIQKQHRLIERFQRAENLTLPQDFDYRAIAQLRNEAKEKLAFFQPANLGQASRISGINPADITVLLIHLQKKHS